MENMVSLAFLISELVSQTERSASSDPARHAAAPPTSSLLIIKSWLQRTKNFAYYFAFLLKEQIREQKFRNGRIESAEINSLSGALMRG